jgi:hypothetical protein
MIWSAVCFAFLAGLWVGRWVWREKPAPDA